MKKMICEICGSMSFKKENGVYVCKECGTEYSIEEAKKLLQEQDGDSPIETKENIFDNAKTVDESKRTKLGYDLLCWHNFYKKCHELEGSFYIADNNKNSCVDIASRPVEYDFEKYYGSEVLPQFNKKYVDSEPSISERYNLETERRKKANATRAEDIRVAASNNSLYKFKFWIWIPAFVGIGLTIILLIVGVASSNWGVAFCSIFTPLIGLVLSMPLLKISRSHETRELNEKMSVQEYKIQTFDEWFGEHISQTLDYKIKERRFHENFLQTAKDDANSVIEKIPEMRSVKTKLCESMPVPEKYSDEKHIDALLALVLDGRADTLKEAINLYETESYRNAVVNSLNVLNYNIIQLNNNIQKLSADVKNLSNSVYQGFSAIIQQNNLINQQLESIRFDTKYLMIDSLLS